ncbi:MAG: amidase [Myxococcota bacterium]
MSVSAAYDTHDALGLAELVRTGEVSAAELLETAIERIERVNPQINAVVRPLYDLARRQAAGGPTDGPFAGVPFLIKDLIQTIPGVPTESGARFYKGFTPRVQTELLRRWQAAGAVVVGKTATSELGLLPVTETDLCGATRNPWDIGRTPGGSSGGSGAAVGARLVPFASGGDGGGSIRIPASCCGLFGHKPSRARNPVGPTATEHWSGFVSEHVLSVSVRDSAAMLDATHGPDLTAPYAAQPIEGSFLEATQRDPKPLRIAFHCEPALPATVHQDCIHAAEDAARLCEDLGHDVDRISPHHDPESLGRALVVVLGSNVAAEVAQAERAVGRRATASDFQLTTWISGMLGRAVSGRDFMMALQTLQAESRRLAELYEAYDLVLTPTLGTPPVKIGELDPVGVDAVAQKVLASIGWSKPLSNPSLIDRAAQSTFSFVPFTPVANFTGQPSMSVPLYWNEAGLPIGVMFTGRPADEPMMFALAGQLERARPWRDRIPAIHG